MPTLPVFATPADAEAAFYRAFAQADLNGMTAVWADAPDIVCVHPMGESPGGRQAVLASWRSVLGSGYTLEFKFSELHWIESSELVLHTLYEHILIVGSSKRPAPLLATNGYRWLDGSWRMVLHHASLYAKLSDDDGPAPPQTYH